MNVPFALPAYFKATTRFKRDLKKLSVPVREEVAEAVAGIVERTAKEKHKPRKYRSEKGIYIITISAFRLFYKLIKDKSGQPHGLLLHIERRPKAYRPNTIH